MTIAGPKEIDSLYKIALALDALVALKLWELRDHPPSGVEMIPAQPVQRWLFSENVE